MDIKAVSQNISGNVPEQLIPVSEKGAKPFLESLKESMSQVNQLQKVSGESVTDLVAGKDQDLHQTMIAVEKADISFQLMMQVRNKIVSAYEEINRMQL